jgi:hypothetical protein
MRLTGFRQEDLEEMHRLRIGLAKLLKNQQPLDSYFKKLSVHGNKKGHAKTPKPPSPKVARPKIYSHPTYPAAHYGHPPPQPHIQYQHVAPPAWAGIGDVRYIPPPVPEIPQSPTYSSASSHTYSNGSTDSEPVAHWAMKIFDGRHSTTPFQTLGEQTVCNGRDEPRVIQMLDDDGFEKVLEIPFEAKNVLVRLYWRADDNRARIIFLTKDVNGRRLRHQIPMTALSFRRTDSSLQLCRVNREDGQLDLWAKLRFTLYERKHVHSIDITPI